MILTELIVKARGMDIIPMTNQLQMFSLVEPYASRGNEDSCALSGAAADVWFCTGNATMDLNPGRKL